MGGGKERGDKSDAGLGAHRCDAAMTVVVAVVAVVLLPGLCSAFAGAVSAVQ
jgi:hypothetical protein